MIYNASNTKYQRPELWAYLEKKRFKRVIDIGGADNPWAGEHVTAYLDLRDPHEYLKGSPSNRLKQDLDKAKIFLGDVNDPDGWEEVNEDVKINGKFDFCICSHILEDIRNPPYVIKQLPKIANAGFIAFPSAHWELGQDTEMLAVKPEDKNMEDWGLTRTFKGFFHHRWIFTLKKNVLWVFPKLNFLEVMEGFEWVRGRNAFHEMTFWWEGDIPFKLFRDDYLGCLGSLVLRDYRKELICEDI